MSNGSARVTDVRPLLRLRLPFVFRRLPHGKLYFTLDVERLPSFLDVTPECIAKLRRRFGPPAPSPEAAASKRARIDYAALASEYRALISSGQCCSYADVSRKIGKSRVWVSKVMKRAGRLP